MTDVPAQDPADQPPVEIPDDDMPEGMDDVPGGDIDPSIEAVLPTH